MDQGADARRNVLTGRCTSSCFRHGIFSHPEASLHTISMRMLDIQMLTKTVIEPHPRVHDRIGGGGRRRNSPACTLSTRAWKRRKRRSSTERACTEAWQGCISHGQNPPLSSPPPLDAVLWRPGAMAYCCSLPVGAFQFPSLLVFSVGRRDPCHWSERNSVDGRVISQPPPAMLPTLYH